MSTKDFFGEFNDLIKKVVVGPGVHLSKHTGQSPILSQSVPEGTDFLLYS